MNAVPLRSFSFTFPKHYQDRVGYLHRICRWFWAKMRLLNPSNLRSLILLEKQVGTSINVVPMRSFSFTFPKHYQDRMGNLH